MIKYLAFLKALTAALIKAGDQFPAVWANVIMIAQKFQETLELLNPPAPAPMAFRLEGPGPKGLTAMLKKVKVDHIPIDPETESAEQHLASLLNKPQTGTLKALPDDEGLKALGDGTFLRALFAFLQANPQLMTFILSLLGVKLPGTVQV